MGNPVRYQRTTQYKYRTIEKLSFMTQCQPEREVRTATGFVRLEPSGKIHLTKGYAWNGASGPAIDTANVLVPSLVHDALYQLISEGELDLDPNREHADQTLRTMCLGRGMWRARAWWIWKAVRLFGRNPALSRSEPRVMAAP